MLYLVSSAGRLLKVISLWTKGLPNRFCIYSSIFCREAAEGDEALDDDVAKDILDKINEAKKGKG